MTDREKQILTITQDLSDCLEYDIEDSSIVDTYDTACKLVDKSWVKLSENNVVLLKEEWKEYEQFKSFMERNDWENIEHMETTLDKCQKVLYERLQQESKETAQKFYEFAEAWFEGYEQNDYLEEVKNLARQCGVKIKE